MRAQRVAPEMQQVAVDAASENIMAAALELIVLPAILLTLLVLVLVKASFSAASVFAGAVFLGLLCFVVIALLRQMRRSDNDQAASERKARELAERQAANEH